MIPILYGTNETSFNTNGIGRLTDAISCVVTEEKNTNNYVLQMEYPVSGQYFNELTIDKIIYATHDTSGIPQAFDIYQVSEPHGTVNKTITVNAKHISRRLSTVVACAGGTISDGPASYLAMLNDTAAEGGLIFGDCPFTFYSDIPDSSYPSSTDPDFWKSGYLTSKNQPVETILLDKSMGLLSERQYPGVGGNTQDEGFGDVGEYLFDMFNVSLLQHRGSDNGVKFRTGKNVRQLTVETDSSDVVTAVIPFWQGKNPISGETQFIDLYTSYEPSDDELSDTEANVNYDHAIIYGPTQYPYQKTKLLDLSSVWKQPPTYDELYQAGYEWLERHAYNVLTNHKSYVVDLVAMSDNTSALQAANLCDYVTVQDEKLQESAKVQIVKVVYDTLHDRYVSMEVGAPRKTLPELVKKQNAIWIEKVQQTATEVSDLAEKTVVENVVKPTAGTSPSSSSGSSSTSSSSDEPMYDNEGKEVEQIATINRQPVYAHKGGGGGTPSGGANILTFAAGTKFLPVTGVLYVNGIIFVNNSYTYHVWACEAQLQGPDNFTIARDTKIYIPDTGVQVEIELPIRLTGCPTVSCSPDGSVSPQQSLTIGYNGGMYGNAVMRVLGSVDESGTKFNVTRYEDLYYSYENINAGSSSQTYHKEAAILSMYPLKAFSKRAREIPCTYEVATINHVSAGTGTTVNSSGAVSVNTEKDSDVDNAIDGILIS